MGDSSMSNETVAIRNKTRFAMYGRGTEIHTRPALWFKPYTGTFIDIHSDTIIVNHSVDMYPEPKGDQLATYEQLVDIPNSYGINASSDQRFWEQERGEKQGFGRNVAKRGGIIPTCTGVSINWADDIPSLGNTGLYQVCPLSGNEFSDQWKVVVNPVSDDVPEYATSILNYGQVIAMLATEPNPVASDVPESIDEVIDVINSIGGTRVANRLKYLASDDILEEGDTPVNLDVCIGFMEFFTNLTSDAYLNLTCAKGWLCTEWDFPDDKAVILWFMGRDTARVTVFDSDGNLVDINDGQQVRDRRTIMKNLVASGYFFVGRSTPAA